MQIKILIIGKNSFLGKNLFLFLNKKVKTRLISFKDFCKIDLSKLNKTTHIINCSVKKEYINFFYKKKFDTDYFIVRKILKTKINYIHLSSRKVYKLGENLTERSKLLPLCKYSKNKLITEKLIKKNLKNRYLILRISNVVGKMTKSKNKVHNNFLSNFLYYKKKNIKLEIDDEYKDFITTNQLSLAILKLIKNNIKGIFNISLGQRVYLSEITNWLDSNFAKSILFNKGKNYLKSFTLSNAKLLEKIKIRITKNALKIFCKNLI